MLNELAQQVHQNAIDKGFFEDEKSIGEMLCLIHSEVSEALEADRKNDYVASNVDMKYIIDKSGSNDFKESYNYNIKHSFEEEMADIIIRVLDLCAFKNIDIDAHVKAKMRYNSLREKYHSKKY